MAARRFFEVEHVVVVAEAVLAHHRAETPGELGLARADGPAEGAHATYGREVHWLGSFRRGPMPHSPISRAAPQEGRGSANIAAVQNMTLSNASNFR